MTDAPPPATIVQTRPSGLRTVSFSEAPVLASSSSMKASFGVGSRPKGVGNSMSPHLLAALEVAVLSSLAARSSGVTLPPAGDDERVDLEVGEVHVGVELEQRLDEAGQAGALPWGTSGAAPAICARLGNSPIGTCIRAPWRRRRRRPRRPAW
jgi:hypothetical protein